MTGTNSQSNNPTDPVVVTDGAGPLTVDGVVAVSNFPAVQPVSDNGGSLTVDGAVAILGPVTVTDGGGPLTVDGTVSATMLNRRDTFDEVLCDTVTQFLRRYTVNDAGVVTITNTTLDGTTAYVPVGAVSRCAGSRTDEVQVMCDSAGPFLRRLSWDLAGVLTVTNLTLAGGPYAPAGTVTFSGGRNASAITVTLLSGVSSVVSSVTARRVTFVYGNNDSVAANRPAINGVAMLESPNGTAEQINTLVLGDLATGGFVPATTFAVREAGDSANVIQEF